MPINVSSTLGKIKLITSPTLLQQLFSINAPALKINWGRFNSKNRGELAPLLEEELSKLNHVDAKQHDDMCSVLSAIFNVASDSDNMGFMHNQIKSIGLWDEYTLYNYGLNEKAVTVANTAAWIHVNSANPQLPADKREELDQLWIRLLVMSDNIEKSHDFYYFDISPQTKFGEESRAGLTVFMEKYSSKLKSLTGFKSYPISPSVVSRGNYLHYEFNTPQYPHDTTQTEGDQFFIGRDPNATGFIIDHYHSADYLKISRITDKAITHRVAESFAKHVLGAVVEDKKHLHYPLEIFRDRSYQAKLTLPDPIVEEGGRVWVSAIDCIYSYEDGTIDSVFKVHDCQDDDIYKMIDRHFPVDQYPVERRCILLVEISFSLYKHTDIGARRPARAQTPNTYRLPFKPTGKNPFANYRSISPEHRQIITEVIKRCGLEGKSLHEIVQSGEE